MATRIVEWKKPYTWWKAIEITEDKVINLRLRDENNLIIYDEWDNEIYVDLQLPDEITPTDAFPVWVTTGRVIVDNGWDWQGTIVCFKTTSWDNIKLLYADDWKLYIDNWTGTFKQIYLKWEVDALLQALRDYVDQQLALKQDKLIAWDNISIAADGKTISATTPPMSRFLSLWDCSTWQPISFPASTPFEYITWDHFLVETVDTTTNYRPSWTEYTGVASTTVETEDVQVWDLYIYDGTAWLLQLNHDKEVSFANIAWQPTDNTNLATALGAKQDTLVNQTNIKSINWNSLLGSGDLTIQAWVTSVNSQTWAVVLDADDISDTNTTNKFVTANDKTTWDWKQSALTLPSTPTQWNLVTRWANNTTLADWWAIPTGVPSGWNNWDVLTNVSWTPTWAAPSGWDVQISTQSWNILTSWAKIWAWIESDYQNLWSYDNNTIYITV